jgi:hypothetical protein
VDYNFGYGNFSTNPDCMKKLLIAFLLIISSCRSKKHAVVFDKTTQDDNNAFVAAESSDAEPPFGLEKVKKMIHKRKDDFLNHGKMDDSAYASLSLREQFTYNMINPEQYAQTCTIYFPQDEEYKQITAQLPRISEGFTWGEHQWKFFSTNKDSVIALMEECINKDNQVGLNFKRVIEYLNAKQMILLLVNMYNNGTKDHGLLTVLMLLMKEGKYPPFLAAPLYKKLYGDENASYKTNTEFNSENEKLIIDLATTYYHATSK